MQEKPRSRLLITIRLWKTYWYSVFVLSVMVVSSAWAEDEPSKRLEALKLELRKDFPEVKQLTIQNFMEHRDQHLLIDVRAEEEFQVSRIPGAIHIDNSDQLLSFAAEHPDQSIVLYCSVGVRSSKTVQLLQKHGFNNVANLEGSIFEWANTGRPLVNEQGSTNTVHPYNFWWGWRYLTPEARAQ